MLPETKNKLVPESSFFDVCFQFYLSFGLDVGLRDQNLLTLGLDKG